MEPTVRNPRVESAIGSELLEARFSADDSRAPAGQFPPEIQSPGTEFLDAETGAGNPPQAILIVCRDRERGKWARADFEPEAV